MAAELKTRVLSEHGDPAWAALVASSPGGSIHSNPVIHFKSQLEGSLELNLELRRRDHTMQRLVAATTAGRNNGKRLLGRALRAVRRKRT